MSNGWVMPDEVLRDAPSYAPRGFELADLELLLSGGYTPLTGFLGPTDLATVTRSGRLADGSSWPVPVTLEVPERLATQIDPADPRHRVVVLTDPEGAPVAALDAVEMWPTQDGLMGLAGPVRRIGDGTHGWFARLRRSPEQIRALLPPGPIIGVIADRPLHRPQLAQIAHTARTLGGHVLIIVPVAGPTPDGLPAEALVRAILAAQDRMPSAVVVAVPLASHQDEIRDALLRARVAAAYGVTHLLATGETPISGGGPRVLVPREFCYDTRDGQWRGSDDVPPRFRRQALSAEEINDALDRGTALPEWHTPPAVARQLARDRPAHRHRGLVLFFTGLPGSGKSTVARYVADTLLETGERTVTLLDGDVVRRELSAGLGFSKADRDLNIRRIGWVAAEIGRHGGLAICCPIAPYAQARVAARRLALAAGAGFVLVYMSTPLSVCEARDRKGHYARARAGEISDMTGIQDPYEAPTDAEVSLDTSDLSVPQAAAEVLGYLGRHGWIDRRRGG